MWKIETPASSANLGPGFDCLGLALDLYNTFTVQPADETKLIGVEDRFNNNDNLFLQAYRKGCAAFGKERPLEVTFTTRIPVSRGLGSSSSLITAGITAACLFNGKEVNKKEIFELAAEMEGHPDNAAPCVYGGLCASSDEGGSILCELLPLDENWKFYVLIPDFEVSTEKARGILPDVYPRAIAARNAAHAVLMVQALENGDVSLLRKAAVDYIHEPYRRTLIHGYDTIRALCTKQEGAFLISGSGSTCLFITKESLPQDVIENIANKKDPAWKCLLCQPAYEGTLWEYL